MLKFKTRSFRNEKRNIKPLVPVEEWEIRPEYDERDWQLPLTAVSQEEMQQDIINSKTITDIAKQYNGTCTGESMAYFGQQATGIVCSGDFSYLMAKKYDNMPNKEGSSLIAVCKGAQKDGICKLDLYPRVTNVISWQDFPKPSKEAVQDALTRRIDSYYQVTTLEQVFLALKEHKGLLIAIMVCSNFFNPEFDENGDAYIDLPEGFILGGHAMRVLDWLPNKEFTYKDGTTRKGFLKVVNSHGVGYGNGGFIHIPFDFLISKTDYWDFTYDMRVPVINNLNQTSIVKDIDVSPVIVNNRAFLPFRHLGEAYGAEVNWDSNTKKVTLILGNREVIMHADSNIAYVNGKSEEMDVTPFIYKNRIMIPIRFAGEFLGGSVQWNGGDKKIKISLNKRDVYMWVDRKYLVIK